jgi:hypothetical protein
MDLAGHGIAIGQNRLLGGVEQAGAFPVRQDVHLGLGQPFLERDRGMLLGLVGRAVQVGDLHDDQFPERPGERALMPDGGQVPQPAFGDRAAVQQHGVEVQYAAALADDAVRQLLGFGLVRVGVGHAGQGRFLLKPDPPFCRRLPRQPAPSRA